jgi:excisionase family DNA binding protein
MEVALSSQAHSIPSLDVASKEIFLTSKEAAQIARLHPVTLLRWARQGKVPHRRLSARKIVFPLAQLKAWLESGYTDSTVRAA